MQLKVKLQKRGEIRYLDENKQQRRYRSIYLEVSKLQERHEYVFKDKGHHER